MKNLLCFSGILFFPFFSAFSQMDQDDVCEISHKSYKICIKTDIQLNGIDRRHVVPRALKESEYCLVENSRDSKVEVVISLDEIHEVIIYPYNDNK